MSDRRRPLPAWARVLIGAPVPRELRDSVVGDFAEEFDRRSRARSDGGAAWGWLLRQILASAPAWIRHRSVRSGSVRTVAALAAGLGAALAVLGLANTGPVLAAAEALPLPGRLAVSWGVNLLAAALGAYVAGRAAPRPSATLVGIFSGILLGLPVLALWVRSGGARAPQPGWALALCGAAVCGVSLARRARSRA